MRSKELLTLIKKAGAVRKFKKTKISEKDIKLIVEAGLWGPSIFGVQPWHFVIIKKSTVIKRIASIVYKNAYKKQGGVRKLLQLSSEIIRNCVLLIAIYNNGRIKRNAAKYGAMYAKKSWVAELLSSGASTQNMFLTLNSIGLGGVWLDAPVIFPKEINKLLEEDDEIVSFVAIGYPNQEIRRSCRDYKKIIKFI